MKLINELKSLENIIITHNNLIEKESRNLLSEYSISSSEKTQAEINEIENDNRLLQIGIVGRVKAGKSSLLNALLFDGKSVLPKAATPMTAALTVISYGENLSAEVEFFTKNDIENIKNDADRYDTEFTSLLKQKIEDKRRREQKKIERQNKRLGKVKDGGNNFVNDKNHATEQKNIDKELKSSVTKDLNKSEPSLSASHDQYQRIKKSGVNYANLEHSKIVPFDSMESLGEDLVEYVGSGGKYMPFTKSVHITIPLTNLKNIQIVDTPGVNDPVASREERTRELLKFCDVIFIVSPAGQFMSSEDLELMDRITSKEGVRELFVIASKCDMQLYGSIKDNSGGDLHKAFDSITTDLASSLNSTLSNLKKTNPEIGDAYDKLIEQSKESIIHSSGISLTIKEAYDNQVILDSGEAHAWGMLVDNYPDYFSKTDKKLTIPNLNLLSNMDIINKNLSDVRGKKDAILAERKEGFLKAKSDALIKYKKDLLRFIELRIEEVNDGDVDELKARRKRLNHIKLTVSGLVDEEYYDLVDELKINMSNKLKSELKNHFKTTKGDIDNAEGTDSETYEIYMGRGGFLWLSKKYETRTRSFITVRTGAVKSSLTDLTTEVEGSIESVSDIVILSWRKNLTPALLSVLRENVDDEDLNPSQIRKVVRNVINRVDFPSLSYSSNSIPSGSGTLTKSSAESFLDEAKSYLNSLKQRVSGDVESYLDKLISELKDLAMSDEIFSEYDSQLEDLEKQIKNKEIILDEYKILKNKISRII